MWIRSVALLCLMAAPPALAQGASNGAPLSVIDWLSDSLAAGDTPVPPSVSGPDGEPAVTTSALPEAITVTPLGEPSADGVGLISADSLGLPRDLWGASSGADLARRFADQNAAGLPAMRDLVQDLATAELTPPPGDDPAAPLFFARVDALLAMGALDPAERLLERAGLSEPERFRRWFDITLLTGTEDKACRRLRASPDLIPTYSARVFCLARGGDWAAAALTLETAEMLEVLSPEEGALLAHFLDAELFEDAEPPALPTRPSPLTYRMYEAIGEVIPTPPLPVAFAHADLRPVAGWKAEVAAAERLVRAGAIKPAAWRDVWLRRLPAASGGVWDRVAAFQAFDRAAEANDKAAAASALPRAWTAMQTAGLEPAFAVLYAPKLQRLGLPEPARDLAWRIGLLSPQFGRLAAAPGPEDAESAFLRRIAGVPTDQPAANDTGAAILAGLAAEAPPERFQTLIANGRTGEAVLEAVNLFNAGAEGDTGKLTDAVAMLRHAGLERHARQAALQVLLLAPDP